VGHKSASDGGALAAMCGRDEEWKNLEHLVTCKLAVASKITEEIGFPLKLDSKKNMLKRRRNPWRKLAYQQMKTKPVWESGTGLLQARDLKISEFAQKELHIVKSSIHQVEEQVEQFEKLRIRSIDLDTQKKGVGTGR